MNCDLYMSKSERGVRLLVPTGAQAAYRAEIGNGDWVRMWHPSAVEVASIPDDADEDVADHGFCHYKLVFPSDHQR